ncbi:LRP16 family protein [Cryptococcus neoformans Tu259-1]|uniref:LRP16 family protein n=1 Tax=Cryptococcus neoformans Tu259-1 TaxID=1230072 RepID=A0A854Q7V3_CRYNE|nr:LRP16 family protein [Cryptococcus neoformans var. grubii Tu259-1]
MTLPRLTRRLAHTMTTSVSPADIPTLSQLYHDDLTNPVNVKHKYAFRKQLNDRISIWGGDITKLEANMIVNAANSSLLGGGGVDGAIHSAAGKQLLEECKSLGGAHTGETKFTNGYNLPSKKVAHTVGPVYRSYPPQRAAQLLKSCYTTSLEGCRDLGGGVIGFSSISTGVYGYPIKDATHIALETTRQFLEQDDTITRVIYVVFSKRDEDVYREIVPQYFPPDPEHGK